MSTLEIGLIFIILVLIVVIVVLLGKTKIVNEPEKTKELEEKIKELEGKNQELEETNQKLEKIKEDSIKESSTKIENLQLKNEELEKKILSLKNSTPAENDEQLKMFIKLILECKDIEFKKDSSIKFLIENFTKFNISDNIDLAKEYERFNEKIASQLNSEDIDTFYEAIMLMKSYLEDETKEQRKLTLNKFIKTDIEENTSTNSGSNEKDKTKIEEEVDNETTNSSNNSNNKED